MPSGSVVSACLVRNPVDLAQKPPKGVDVPALVPHYAETPCIYLALHIAEANHQTHRFLHSEHTCMGRQYKGLPQPWRLDKVAQHQCKCQLVLCAVSSVHGRQHHPRSSHFNVHVLMGTSEGCVCQSNHCSFV